VIDVYDTPFEPVALDEPFASLEFVEPVDDVDADAAPPAETVDAASDPDVLDGTPDPEPATEVAFADVLREVEHPAPSTDVDLGPLPAVIARTEPPPAIVVATPAVGATISMPINGTAVATPVKAIAQVETGPQLSENALLEILLAQTAPFSDDPTIDEEHEQQLEDLDYGDSVISLLLAGGISQSMARTIIADARRELAPFEPGTPLRTLARRTLADRLAVRHGTRAKRRTIALVGPPGAGKTLTAAKLCNIYASSGRSVAAVSLEPARQAMRLAMFTDMVDVELEVADATKSIMHARERTANTSIVIADTPAIVPGKRASFMKVARLLAALEPDETHLLLPADSSFDEGRALIDAASDALPVNRLLITHADRPAPIGVAVGLSLASKLPVSYVTESAFSTGGIRPAEPRQLARMIL
jgi:flagellar biosynthesis protein FlhF